MTYCDHLHADVDSPTCGLCFLSGEADVDFYIPSRLYTDDEALAVFRANLRNGWDACREKHIKEAKMA